MGIRPIWSEKSNWGKKELGLFLREREEEMRKEKKRKKKKKKKKKKKEE